MVAETAPTPAPKRARASQDQALANKINQYRTSLTSAQGNAELVTLLQPRGYDGEALAAGLSLCDAAQAAFNARQDAQAAQKQAAKAAGAADEAARAGFNDFRKIARAVFKDNASAQGNLGVTGRVPDDQEKFLTLASAVYTSALSHSTYMTALARRGYDQAAIEAEQARLDAVTQTNSAHETAKAAAVRATSDRDAAAKALDDWWAEFRAVAQVALKDRPDFLGLLGL